LLEGDAEIQVVGTAAGGDEALEVALRERPDVVLMDLSMPGMGGAEATRRLVGGGSDARVVVLTSLSARERILEALDAGAIGYLLKDAEPDELIRGIQAAARGESPLDPRAARTMLSAQRTSDPLDALSDREREVLALVAEGLPNKQIARRLEITEKTVKAHLTSVFRAIGVTDRMQAALWARRHGL
jgi:DNA-binding NarL/FixJ family response regulator